MKRINQTTLLFVISFSVAAILHGTMNATVTISIIPVSGGNDLLVGVPGLAGFIALTIVIAGIFAYDQFISKEKIMTEKIVKHLQ